MDNVNISVSSTEFWVGIALISVYALLTVLGIVSSFIKMLKSERRVKTFVNESKEDIVITREGIVEAFKEAKIDNNVKISIARQVDDKLDEWTDRLQKLLKAQEEQRTKLVLMCTKIMSYTSAFDMLSNDEKKELKKLMKSIVEEDGLVEIYLPNREK